MFDTLTDAERLALRSKLFDWSHEFAEVGLRLAGVARARGTYDHQLFEHATPYYAAMSELHAIRDELAA